MTSSKLLSIALPVAIVATVAGFGVTMVQPWKGALVTRTDAPTTATAPANDTNAFAPSAINPSDVTGTPSAAPTLETPATRATNQGIIIDSPPAFMNSTGNNNQYPAAPPPSINIVGPPFQVTPLSPAGGTNFYIGNAPVVTPIALPPAPSNPAPPDVAPGTNIFCELFSFVCNIIVTPSAPTGDAGPAPNDINPVAPPVEPPLSPTVSPCLQSNYNAAPPFLAWLVGRPLAQVQPTEPAQPVPCWRYCYSSGTNNCNEFDSNVPSTVSRPEDCGAENYSNEKACQNANVLVGYCCGAQLFDNESPTCSIQNTAGQHPPESCLNGPASPIIGKQGDASLKASCDNLCCSINGGLCGDSHGGRECCDKNAECKAGTCRVPRSLKESCDKQTDYCTEGTCDLRSNSHGKTVCCLARDEEKTKCTDNNDCCGDMRCDLSSGRCTGGKPPPGTCAAAGQECDLTTNGTKCCNSVQNGATIQMAQLACHIFESTPGKGICKIVAGSGQACIDDSDCAAQTTCQDGACCKGTGGGCSKDADCCSSTCSNRGLSGLGSCQPPSGNNRQLAQPNRDNAPNPAAQAPGNIQGNAPAPVLPVQPAPGPLPPPQPQPGLRPVAAPEAPTVPPAPAPVQPVNNLPPANVPPPTLLHQIAHAICKYTVGWFFNCGQ